MLIKKRVSEVYEAAEKQNKKVISVAEWLGEMPLILKLAE